MLSDWCRNMVTLIPPKSEANVSQKRLNGEVDHLSYRQRYKKNSDTAQLLSKQFDVFSDV